jgi:hypothetical protein
MASEAGIPIVESNPGGVEGLEFMRIADRLREVLPV